MKKRLVLLLVASLMATPVLAKGKAKHVRHKTVHHKVVKAQGPFRSPVVLITNENGEKQFQKNAEKVVSIASITKLMISLITVEADLPMDEEITLIKDDAVSHSKTSTGEKYTRAELLNIALMSSDNRAAHALARTYPGGLNVAIQKMNDKAAELGMKKTKYVEPTGLSKLNKSTAEDLQKLLVVVRQLPTIVEYTSMPSTEIKERTFKNTNAYVRDSIWDNVIVSKTGTTSAAGKCVAVVVNIDNQDYSIVLLGARNSKQRMSDLATAKEMIIKRM